MPKSLHIHSNERIDLPDFELAANGYSHSLRSHQISKAMLDKHSRVLSGFRIELADQATSPGQLTVHAGLAFDKSGAILDIEDQPDASLTTTLAGASQTFYLEVEYTETESDLDSRGFWDPTVDQSSPIPDGGEVLVSVSTRKTPGWKIVSPISTTGFTYLSLPNSTRIPIAVLSTDVSNQIDPSVNLFSFLEYPSTVTVADYEATDTVLSVVDSHLFPIGSVVTIDLGGTSPEVGRTVINNDLENHVLTVSPALATSHFAGAIIRRTDSGTDTLIPEQTDPNDAAYSAVTPATRPNDYRKRFFGGDERRGSGLLKSAKTFGIRDDLKLKTEKDYKDYIAAVLRDLKFGSPRADIVSSSPPIVFSSTPRYFDASGSIAGSRSITTSIGNGTTTFGDFNGTTDAVFTAAISFLAANGGGILFVKKGTYVFTNQVTIPDGLNVHILGESNTSAELQNDRAATACFVVADSGGLTSVTFENVLTSQTGGSTIFLSGTGSFKLSIIDCTFTGISTLAISKLNVVDSTLSNANIFTTLTNALFLNSNISGTLTCSTSLTKSTFINTKLGALTIAALQTTHLLSCEINATITISGSLSDVVVENCSSSGSVLPAQLFNVTGSSVQRLSLVNCKFTVYSTNVFTQASGSITNLLISNCDFRSSDVTAQTVPLFNFVNTTVTTANIVNSTFISPMTTSGPVTSILSFANVANLQIEGCSFSTAGSLSTSNVNVVRTISFANSVNSCIRDCSFAQSTSTEYTQGIYTSGAADLLVDNCSFTNGYSAVTLVNSGSTVDQLVVSNCEFNHSAAIDYSALNLSGSQVLAASILGCSFNYNGISGAGLAKQGVLFENIQSSLTVSNCNFTDFGLNSTAGTYGINVTSTAEDSTVHVYNNTFADFSSAAAMSAVRCVATGITISVQHNTITDFSGTGTANGAIAVSFAVNTNISNNSFTNVVLSDIGVDVGAAVTCISSTNVKINNNNLYNVAQSTGMLSSINTSNDDANIEISNNTINVTIASLTNVPMSGIICRGAATIKTASICNNSIILVDAALAGTGIHCGDTGAVPALINVSNNIVQLEDGVSGISLACVNGTCIGNTVRVGDGSFLSTGGPGIFFDATLGGVISNNVVPGADVSYNNITASGNGIIVTSNLVNTYYDVSGVTGLVDANNL